MHRKKKVSLVWDCFYEKILVQCDENRLKQVILNFIKNGIEAMPDGGVIKVITELKEDKVHISITDTGIGMPPEQLKRLESHFSRQKSGNGLGLMISFKIIESHLGNVFVESEVNRGTAFNIVLPTK